MHFERAHNHTWRKIKSALAIGIAFGSAILVITPLGLVFFYLLINGASSVNWDFFTKLPAPVGALGGGMANAIVGTLQLLALAGVIGIPVGVLGGVYLAEYGSTRGNSMLRFVADVLNGVPSITWGVVVYGLVVLPFKGFSAYAGGLALGFDTGISGVGIFQDLPGFGPGLEPCRAIARRAIGNDLGKALALGAVLRAVGTVAA